MADYTIPLQVQQPNILGAMGNLVNTAQGIQAFQSGQIQQQRLGINLQSEAQANQERKNVIQAMNAGDPALLPDDMGIIDPAKSQARLQQLAPQTWSLYTGNIQTSNKNNIGINNDLRALSDDARKSLGEAIQPTIGKPISFPTDATQDWMDAHSREPTAQKIGKQLQASYAKVDPNNQDAVDFITSSAFKRANSIQAQIDAGTPTYQQFGGQVAQTKPGIPGIPQTSLKPNTQGIIPATPPPGYIVDANGNLHLVGSLGGPSGITGGGPSSPWMNKTDADTAAANAAAITEARARGSIQPMIRNTIATLLPIIDGADVKLGPGADRIQQITGPLNTISNGKWNPGANGFSETEMYLNRLALQTAQTFGQQSVAGTLLSQSASGTPTGTKQALLEKLRNIDGLTAMGQAHDLGLSQAAGTGANQNPTARNAYEQTYNQALGTDGPTVFRIKADYDRGDPQSLADAERIIKQSGKPRAYWVSRADALNAATGGFLYR